MSMIYEVLLVNSELMSNRDFCAGSRRRGAAFWPQSARQARPSASSPAIVMLRLGRRIASCSDPA